MIFLRILFLISMLTVSLFPQRNSIFYHGQDYGSASLVNPGYLILNGGFEILRFSARSRQISKIEFQNGTKNVFHNISHPIAQIDKIGWNNFIRREIFPTSLDIREGQWVPNYFLHLIGSGIDRRMMTEWYEYHHFSYPSLWAGATMAVSQVINEIVENNSINGPNADPIADIYIFDLASVLLFSSDVVADFFGNTLQMTSWPGQPMWNPEYHTLENIGLYYSARYKPVSAPVSMFGYIGDCALFGISTAKDNGESISVAAGATQKGLRMVNSTNGTVVNTMNVGWMIGVFIDRKNSLLASLKISNDHLNINIYPGVINLLGFSPGLFASLGSNNQIIAGFSLQYSPLGLAYRNKL